MRTNQIASFRFVLLRQYRPPKPFRRKWRRILIHAKSPLRIGRMKGHESRLLIDRDMQAGDIGETDEDLWVATNYVIVELVDDPRRPITASSRKDRVHFW